MDANKLSVADCKRILSKKGKQYSDNEIISIRDLLYCFAQVDIDTFYHLERREKVASENVVCIKPDDESENIINQKNAA